MSDTTAGPDSAQDSTAALEKFGYRQELKRSLSLLDLVVYGLVYINFVAPLTTFGIVFNASRGMVPLVYIVGAIATTFTALSYVYMSRAFPVAGSVYSYAGRGIGESAGFIAGWMILLDYFMLPAVGYVVTAVAIESIVPDLPRAVWVVLFLVFNTTVNLLGIEVTAKWNKVICTIMFATVGLFIVVALVGLANGVGGARLSTTPFFNPPEFSFGVIFGALSVAIAAFLGFDAVSTLAEETRGGPRMVGRATLLALAVASVFMIGESYLASLFALDRDSFPPGQATDGAIYAIALLIGGPLFRLLMVLGKVIVSGIGFGVVGQVGTARVLYGMARDGKLPRFLAHVNRRSRVPDAAIVLVAAINLIFALALANQLLLLISMVSFGALFGFLMLHISVIVHFVVRQNSRDWLRHLVVPLIGIAIVGYMLVNMAVEAKILGLAWLAIGALTATALKLTGRRIAMPI